MRKRMRGSIFHWVFIILCLVGSVPARAATSVSPAQAQQAIQRLTKLLADSQSLSYRSEITYNRNVFRGLPSTRSARGRIRVEGDVTRPRQVRLKVWDGGANTWNFVCNGSIAYEGSDGRYWQYGPRSGPTAPWDMLPQAGPDLDLPALTLAGFLNSDLLRNRLANSAKADSVVYREVLDGKSVLHVTLIGQPVPGDGFGGHRRNAHLWLDEASGLPARISLEIVGDDGQKTVYCREDFSEFRLSAVALPASDFSWTPPMSQVVVY